MMEDGRGSDSKMRVCIWFEFIWIYRVIGYKAIFQGLLCKKGKHKHWQLAMQRP